MIRNALQLSEILTSLYCMSALYGRKMKYSIYAVVLIIADLFLYTGINEYGFPVYLMSFSYIGLFMYGLLEFKEGIKAALVNCLLTTAVVCGLQLIIYLPIYYLFISKYGIRAIFELVINVSCLLLIASFGRKMRLVEISHFLIRKNKLLMAISAFILLALGKRIYQVIRCGTMSGGDYVQMISFLILFFFTVNEWQKAKANAEQTKAQAEINRIYYDAYEDLLTTIRMNQHDIKNHIQAIFGMIHSSSNYEDLVQKQEEYCNCIMKHTSETKILLSTENPLIVGFLYSKIQEAEEKHIEVDYKIYLGHENLGIPEYEMVEMIGILVDNAIEALEVKPDQMKKMKVSIGLQENEIHISVANVSENYELEEIGEFFKKDVSIKGKGRGIGLFKLKKQVDKRLGKIYVSIELYDKVKFLEIKIVLPV